MKNFTWSKVNFLWPCCDLFCDGHVLTANLLLSEHCIFPKEDAGPNLLGVWGGTCGDALCACERHG